MAHHRSKGMATMRWKQTLTCRDCGRSRWREIETLYLVEPKPDPVALAKGGFYCSDCGSRNYDFAQVELNARCHDAMKPGGLRYGLVDFEDSPLRDAQIAEDIARRGTK